MIQVNRIYLIFNRLVTKKFLVDTSDAGGNVHDGDGTLHTLLRRGTGGKIAARYFCQ